MILLLVLLLAACDIGICDGLPGSMAEIRLSAASHPEGWGEAQCYQCHAIASIHQKNCTGSGQTADDILADFDPGDPTSCQICHGDNGVTGDTGPSS